jgi:hypothetical protein
MQHSRSILALALVGVVLAACGGGGPTQGPDGGPGGATQGPDGATQGPVATQTGGGGGGDKPPGWDQYGKASYEISAPISLSGELGFVPAASRFDGEAATSLTFTVDGTEEVLTFVIIQGGASMSFASPSATVVGVSCTTSNLSIQAASAKGSFECTQVTAFMASGASVANVTIKGSFDVHG